MSDLEQIDPESMLSADDQKNFMQSDIDRAEQTPGKNPELIEFSQDVFQEERDRTAQAISEKRTAHFKKQAETGSLIESAESSLLEKQERIASVIETIGNLESYLNDWESSLIKRIIGLITERKAILEATEQLGQNQTLQESLQKEIDDLKVNLDDLKFARLDQTDLVEARTTLSSFWYGISENWQKFEHEKEVRDVKNVMRTHNCFFIHAMVDKMGGRNSVLNPGIDWETQAMIDFVLKPTLSTSTISDTSFGNDITWGNCGLILSGGIVGSASANPSHPKSQSLLEKAGSGGFTGEPTEKRNSEEIIDDAIKNRKHGQRTNEFRINQPEVGAFFYTPVADVLIPIDLRRVEKLAGAAGLPVFIIADGGFYRYEVTGEGKEQKVILGEKIDVQDVIDNHASGFSEDQMLETIFGAEPFDEDYYEHDGRAYGAWNEGRVQYLAYLQKSKDERIKTQVTKLDEDQVKSFEMMYPKEGSVTAESTFEIISSFGKTTFVQTVPTYPGSVVRVKTKRNSFQVGKPFLQEEYPEFGYDNPDMYIQNMLGNLAYSGERNPRYDRKQIYELLGFAEEAKRYGDIETYEDVIQRIPSTLDKEDYNQFLVRRVDTNGMFIKTKEDFKIVAPKYGASSA